MMLAPGWRKMISRTAGLPFDESGGAHVLDRIGDRGDVREPHRGAVAIGDDQRAVSVGLAATDRWR